MNKKDIVEAVYKTGKVTSKKNAADVVNTVFDTIVNGVKTDDTVTIIGFGTFRKGYVTARKGKTPNGEPCKIPARKVPRFKAGKTFKDIIKNSRTKRK